MKFVKLIKAEEEQLTQDDRIYWNAQTIQEIEGLASQFEYSARISGDTVSSGREVVFKALLEAKNKPDIFVNFYDPFSEIQTTSYGFLNVDDYSEFLNDCQNAFACAKAFKEKYNL